MQCKGALEEAGGDEEKAVEILRKKGASAAAKKAERDQSEGSVFSAIDAAKAAVVRLDCETDFVARDDNFQALGQELADAALSGGTEAAQTLADEKVPALVQKLGENITLGEMKVIEAGVCGVYVHSNQKIGVVVGMSGGSADLARDIAMHAAAMNPLYIQPEDVSAESVEKERGIWKEQLSAEGKPEEIMEKIMIGKEKKFREESALTTQEFVKEPGKLVGELIGEDSIVAYERVAV